MSSTPVEVRREGAHSFVATNHRGGRVAIGSDTAEGSFTPGELLLAAVAACSAVTGENLVTRRLGDDAALTATADRDKDPADPHRFTAIRVALDFAADAIEDAEERTRLVSAIERAIGRACTVSRSVEGGTSISLSLPR